MSLVNGLRNASRFNTAKTQIVVAAHMGNAESLRYARGIAEAAQEAGWTVAVAEMSTHAFAGVAIFENSLQNAGATLTAVRSAFEAAKVAFLAQDLDVRRVNIQQSAIYIIVGYK